MVNFQEAASALVIELAVPALDAHNSKHIRRDIDASLVSRKQIVIDLSSVNFIDSSGLGVLISSLRKVSTSGGHLKLTGLAPSVRAVFQLVRMHRLFDIHNTREEALRAFETESIPCP